MDEEARENKPSTYDNWKAVTESDFVTLFIKTWFAFVSTLREMYQESAKPYYEAAGDSPIVEAYKKEFANKFFFLCQMDSGIDQSMYNTYKSGFQMISEKYPRFLEKDFYCINHSYSDNYEGIYFALGGYTGNVKLSIKSISYEEIKVVLCCSGKKFLDKVNEEPNLIEEKINYYSIIEDFICSFEESQNTIEEGDLITFFYQALFQKVFDTIVTSLSQKVNLLPAKGFTQVKDVYTAIQLKCRQAVDNMRNSCMDPDIGSEHKLLSQMPITDYLQKYDSMNSTDRMNAYIWFIGFVYRLRNALFHEIIDPLDVSWQQIFKNAYLVLKQIVDVNIKRLKTIARLVNESKEVYENDFVSAPPPMIPIEDNGETVFLYDKIELIRYDESGAKVHVCSTIVCKEKEYLVNCDVKWDESLTHAKVKNVSIKQQGENEETELQEEVQ